jgi:hypothetical protein
VLLNWDAEDGRGYRLRVASLPERTHGWRGRAACMDAAHRIHARVERAWPAAGLIAATLAAWLRVLALDGHPERQPGPAEHHHIAGRNHHKQHPSSGRAAGVASLLDRRTRH